MRAFVQTRYGGPEATELRDVPVPTPGPGEVAIRVHAAGLNPVDFKTRAGQLKVIRRYPLPIVAGNELSGTVTAVGEGVKGLAPGDRVYARVDKDKLGAFAEIACVSEAFVAKAPASIDLETAAGVPLAALTALQALRDELHVGPGHRVFVSGGAGGVGTFAIQIAKELGATVTTTASARGTELVKRLGADQIVDYTKDGWEAGLSGFDAAFDLVGADSLGRAFSLVKRGARVVSIAGMPEPETAKKDLARGIGLQALFWAASFGLRAKAKKHGATYRYLFMHPSGADLETMARWIDAGKVKVIVDRVFPFDAIAEAMAYLETGRAKGKVIVRVEGK